MTVAVGFANTSTDQDFDEFSRPQNGGSDGRADQPLTGGEVSGGEKLVKGAHLDHGDKQDDHGAGGDECGVSCPGFRG